MRHNTAFASSLGGHHANTNLQQGIFDDDDDEDDPEALYEPVPEENGDDSHHNYEYAVEGVVGGVGTRWRGVMEAVLRV